MEFEEWYSKRCRHLRKALEAPMTSEMLEILTRYIYEAGYVVGEGHGYKEGYNICLIERIDQMMYLQLQHRNN